MNPNHITSSELDGIGAFAAALADVGVSAGYVSIEAHVFDSNGDELGVLKTIPGSDGYSFVPNGKDFLSE